MNLVKPFTGKVILNIVDILLANRIAFVDLKGQFTPQKSVIIDLI